MIWSVGVNACVTFDQMGFQTIFGATNLLPAATKLGQGNIFTGVCLSMGGSASVHAGICPPRTSPPITRPPLAPDPPLDHTTPPHPPGPDPPGSRLQHTVNERPVRILLECILGLLRNLRNLITSHIAPMRLVYNVKGPQDLTTFNSKSQTTSSRRNSHCHRHSCGEWLFPRNLELECCVITMWK